MSSVYFLTLRQLTGRWRIVIMTVLAALPVIIASVMLRSSTAPSVQDFENVVLSAMLAGSIAPLVVLAIAAAAFGNEVEDRTLANLTLAPMPRWQIAVPKLLASFTIAAPFISASAFATSYVAFIGDTTATIAVTVSALIGVALYASLFVWLGLVSTQAIGVGLLYILLWEGFFSRYVAGARAFSIRYYATALMHGMDERRFAFSRQMSAGIALAISIVVFTGFLWLSVRRLRRMDVP